VANRKSNGYTLLELLAASALCAGVLVSSMKMMRQSAELNRRIEGQNMLTTLAVGKMELHLARSAAAFASTTEAGDFAADGFPRLRFHVACSDAWSAGGIPDRLMCVTATVWEDANGNATLDAGEASVSYSSKVASNG
jgi:hypothetical protein